MGISHSVAVFTLLALTSLDAAPYPNRSAAFQRVHRFASEFNGSGAFLDDGASPCDPTYLHSGVSADVNALAPQSAICFAGCSTWFGASGRQRPTPFTV